MPADRPGHLDTPGRAAALDGLLGAGRRADRTGTNRTGQEHDSATSKPLPRLAAPPGQPVISVDAKVEGTLGNYQRPGRTWPTNGPGRGRQPRSRPVSPSKSSRESCTQTVRQTVASPWPFGQNDAKR